MLVDLRLDGIGAGERRVFGHQRSRCAERESGDIPQWLQRGWAHASLGHERVETIEVPLLLGRHPRDELGFRAIPAEHGELAGVDSRRAIFAGLVDPQPRCAVGPPVAGTPPAHRRDAFASRNAIVAAPEREMIAFHPAIEMPRNDHCTSSQRTRGAWVICFRRSAVDAPGCTVAVQTVNPWKILASTPA